MSFPTPVSYDRNVNSGLYSAPTCFCIVLLVLIWVGVQYIGRGGGVDGRIEPVYSVEQKSIGLKFSKSRAGSDMRYSCHHNSSRFTFPIFVHSWRFSVFHSLQSVTVVCCLGYIKNYADSGTRTKIVCFGRLLLARVQLLGLHKEIC
jgi:hypothetical protein